MREEIQFITRDALYELGWQEAQFGAVRRFGSSIVVSLVSPLTCHRTRRTLAMVGKSS